MKLGYLQRLILIRGMSKNKGKMIKVNMENNLTIYVYYKIPTDKHQCYLLAINELNNSIGTLYPYLKMNRQRRLDLDTENRELWMEIYHGIPTTQLEKFTTDLNRLSEKNDLPKDRQHEVFVPL